MWERLYTHDFRDRIDATHLALCARGLVALGSLTELGGKLLNVEWRDADSAAVLCPRCQTAAEYVRTRNLEGGNALVWMCTNSKCTWHRGYFHTLETSTTQKQCTPASFK